MTILEHTFVVRAPLDAVWAFHNNPAGAIKITPGPLHLVTWDAPLRLGSRVHMRLGIGPLSAEWHLIVAEFVPQQYFVDDQVSGPFARWRHTHAFAPTDSGVRVTDHLEYSPPLGLVGRVADALLLKHILAWSFRARARTTARILEDAASVDRDQK